jgi:hypothetical protein
MSPKDSKEPTEAVAATEKTPGAHTETGRDADWPRLLARLVEGVVSAELHEFEDNVMAFLDSAVADAYSTFIWICARVIGAAFLLTGLMLFLGIFLQWWAAFGLVGVVVIALGSFASAISRHPRRRRSRR